MSRTTELSAPTKSLANRLVWPSFGACLILLAVLCWRQIDIADFWWQYRTGQLVADTGVPQREVFSYASAGQPWIEPRWLFCLLLAWTVDHLGFFALNLLMMGLIASAFLLAVSAGNGWRRPALATPIVGIAIVAASHRFVIRPEMVTYALVGFYLFAMAKWREGSSRWMLAIPLLQVIWANVHPLYPLGPALVALLCLASAIEKRKVKALLGILALTTVACLVSPYGLENLAIPMRLLEQSSNPLYRDAIGELHSPFELAFLTSSMAFFVLLGLIAASVIVAGKRIDPLWTLCLLLMLPLALFSVRNLALCALASIPFNLHNGQFLTWRPIAVKAAISTGCIGAAAYACWMVATGEMALHDNDRRYFGYGIAPNAYPIAAVGFLKEQAAHDPVFNTLTEGSYLLSQGVKVYFDPRLEAQSQEIFELGMRATSHVSAFDEVVKRFSPSAALVSLSSVFPAAIATRRGYRLVYFDFVAAVYQAPPGAPWPKLDIEGRLHEMREEMAAWPRAAQIQSSEAVASFLLMVAAYEPAKQWAAIMVEKWPDRWRGHAILGKVHQRMGDPSRAIGQLRTAIELGAEAPDVWRDLAVCQSAVRDFEEATRTAAEATELFPENADAWAMRGVVALSKGDASGALGSIDKAVRLSPDDVSLVVLRAECLMRLGRSAEAIDALQGAEQKAPENVEVQLQLAIALYGAGRREESKKHLDVASQLAPDDPRLPGLMRRLGLSRS